MLGTLMARMVEGPDRAKRIRALSHWTPRLIAATFVAVVGFCILAAWLSRAATLQQAEANCRRSLDVAREHVARVAEDAARTVNSVVSWLQQHPEVDYRTSRELVRLGASLNLDPAQTRAVAIIDSEGMATLLDEGAFGQPVDVSSRPYMAVARSAERGRIVLAPPTVNMNTGAETIAVFSKLIGVDGRDLIVATAFSTMRMKNIFASLAGPHGALELHSGEHSLVAAPAQGSSASGGSNACEAALPEYDLSLKASAGAGPLMREWRFMVAIGAAVLVVLGLAAAAFTMVTLSLLRTLRQDTERLSDLLVQANEAARAKSVFLATMSHELRTPLNAIVGFTESMRLGVFGPLGKPKYYEYCDDILLAARSLMRTYDDVLLAAKADTIGIEVVRSMVDIGALLRELLRLFAPTARERRIELRLELRSDHDGRCWVDQEKLARVLRNLIENSLKYCRPGDAITVMASANARELTVEVSDTGPGVGVADQSSLFSMFYQTADTAFKASHSGVGLGLWLVKKIVEAHAGTVTVASAPGKGFSTTCHFPGPDVERLPD